MVLGLLLALASAQPTDQTLIYYNARMALREGRPREATKLWLLRNALADHSGRVSSHDPDFHSNTWAALGKMGLCQDGLALDTDGGGIWPIALHNWVVRNRRKRPKTSRPSPFKAFEVGRQQRYISIDDVLNLEELRSVVFFRRGCTRPKLLMLEAKNTLTAKLSNKETAAYFMKYLLERSRETLVRERVRGAAAIDARLFDIHLHLAELAARKARKEKRRLARKGRDVGVSRAGVRAMEDDSPLYQFSADSEPAKILKAAAAWPVEEWMSLSTERQLFLFDHARAFGADSDGLDRVATEILDILIDEGRGEEVKQWIARAPESRLVWDGDRGRRLLSLDRDTGFRERSAITLKRGVQQLEHGDLDGALRSFAYSLQYAPDSTSAESIQNLSLRWLSYVAAQFEITDSLLITLQELVPRRDYSVILEDLMWGAAFHTDHKSFQRGVQAQLGRGALNRRMALLDPLAKGDISGFVQQIKAGITASPSETLRFLDQLIQRLELEDADIRTTHILTLTRLREQLAPLTDPNSPGRQHRRAVALMSKTQAIIEGLDGLGLSASIRDRARSLNPNTEVYAGSIRLAPADPLPWPFKASKIRAPTIFAPLDLTPVEWRNPEESLVFGWKIGE